MIQRDFMRGACVYGAVVLLSIGVLTLEKRDVSPEPIAGRMKHQRKIASTDVCPDKIDKVCQTQIDQKTIEELEKLSREAVDRVLAVAFADIGAKDFVDFAEWGMRSQGLLRSGALAIKEHDRGVVNQWIKSILQENEEWSLPAGIKFNLLAASGWKSIGRCEVGSTPSAVVSGSHDERTVKVKTYLTEIVTEVGDLFRALPPAEVFARLKTYCEKGGRRVDFCSRDGLREVAKKFIFLNKAHGADSRVDYRDFITDLISKMEKHSAILEIDASSRDLDEAAYDALVTKKVRGFCEGISGYVNPIESLLGKPWNSIAQSRAAIREIERTVFSPTNVQAMESLVHDSKKQVLNDFVPELFKRARLERSKEQLVERSFEKIHLITPEKISEKLFEKNEAGVVTLIGDRLERSERFTEADTVDFFYSGFETYHSMNAFYRHYTLGQEEGVSANPSIFIYPAYYVRLSRFPLMVRETVVHELAHHLDPLVNFERGIDLRPVYGPLVQCLKKNVGLKYFQSGETVADWISMTINSGRARAQTAKKPIDAFGEVALGNCAYYAQGPAAVDSEDDPHLTSWARLALIPSSVGEVREILGCSAGPKCTLDGEVSP